MSTEPISIDRIHREEAIQSRVSLNAETVADYADAYREGKPLPPITLYHESGSGKLWLADGWHRVAAAEQAGIPHILADVKPGGRREALLCSVGANATHGLRRTNADKKRAVELLLQDSELVRMSDREIARYCCVSQPFVSSVRSTDNAYQSTERVGADGKTRAIKHWGLSNGMPFWMQVEKFGLEKSTIMEQLQPGANVLTDLKASKEDTWRRLDQLACEANAARFPLESYVHNTVIDTYGLVKQVHSTGLRIVSLATANEATWLVKDCKPGSAEGYQKWSAAYGLAEDDDDSPDTLDMAAVNGFELGDKVLVEGSDLVGEIIAIGITGHHEGQICVTRPNPTKPGVNMTHWVKAEKIKPALDMAAINHDLAADLAALHPPKSAPVVAFSAATEPARTPIFADGALVKVIKTGKAGRVLKTLWEGGLHEKCHLELPSTDERGKSYNTYYWYMAEELTLIEPSTNGSQSPVSSSPVIDEWAGDSNADPTPPSSPIGDSERSLSIDDFAPRPWVVEKRPAVYLITDRRGTPLVSTMSIGGEHTDIAYALVRAVNSHRDYTSQQVRDILPSLRRILDFADGMIPAPDTLAEDIFEVQTLLAHLRRTIARNEPSPEAVAP